MKGTLTRGALLDYLDGNKDLINYPDETGMTLLGHALKNGMSSAVKLLLEADADVDAKIGRKEQLTPIYFAVTTRMSKPRSIQLLLEKKPTSLDEACTKSNETPLMAAISRKNTEAIRLLINAGASREAKNASGKTVQELVDEISDDSKYKQAIMDALEPTMRKGGGGGALRAYLDFAMGVLAKFSGWKALGSIFKAASSYFYNTISHTGIHPEEDEPDEEPQSAADFKINLQQVVDSDGLDRFFPPGNTYITEVAEKAAALKDDPSNVLNSPRQIQDLITLALYQVVLYCDDSGSMGSEERWSKQRDIAQFITSIANAVVPSHKGVHLRFINRSTPAANDLDSAAVARMCNSTPDPRHCTPIGKRLEEHVLDPLIYSVVNEGRRLERPYLVMIITDGCPWPESQDELRKSILRCGRFLEAHDYPKDAVRFCISQIGTDDDAKEFMESLDADTEVLDVLHRTTELIDEKFTEYRYDEGKLKNWLLAMLLAPVDLLKSA